METDALFQIDEAKAKDKWFADIDHDARSSSSDHDYYH